jgi:hypothetical protein
MVQRMPGLFLVGMDHKIVFTATTDADKCDHPQLSSYAAMIRSLMYIASCSRPDLSFTSILARIMAKHSNQHLLQAHRPLRYLCKTRDNRVRLGSLPSSAAPLALAVWSDLDHACCVNTCPSVSWLVVCVLSSAAYWRSVRQSNVTKSTMIA